jgi:hypothetical protein
MTAKPQPMSGQSDASDDLIAELAKLMAQDAQGDRVAPPPRPVAPVRIPGGDVATAAAPAPRFDFGRFSPGSDDAGPSSAPAPSQPAAAETPEPFDFDFNLTPSPAPQAALTQPDPVSDAGGTSAFAVEAEPAGHDSIADLIAADMSSEPAIAAPVEPSVAPVSADVPQPAVARAIAQPASGAEPDRFKVAPVFGLASRPVPASERPVGSGASRPIPNVAPIEPATSWRQLAPAADPAPLAADDDLGRDPIDEIESLIGGAVHVELGTTDAELAVAEAEAELRPVPSPALRSLATPTLPEMDAAPDPRIRSGADEAIMAAALATGVEIGWVEAPAADETKPAAAPRRSRAPRALMTRAFAGPLVAVTLLLAAGFGLYWVLGLGGEEGPAPLLTADTSPVKEVPEAQPDAAAAQQSVVFNEINGVVPGAEEQLVSRDQTDLNEVTQIAPATEAGEEGLVNRRVRTVTVRPDGTIVSGDDSVAGSTILPVARPNVPDVPGAETASPELLASREPGATATATTPSAPATPAPEAQAAVAAPVTPGMTVPAVDAAGNALAGKTSVIPMTRPAGLEGPGIADFTPPPAALTAPVSGGNRLPPPPANNTLGSLAAPVQATTAAAPAAMPAGAMEVDALPNNAPAYVQLASQRSEADARASAQAMVTRYGPLFGGANLEVQRVDLGERGIYYRVRVPASSMQEANNICTNVKAAGGDCFTM